jgi:hypothetical protein
MAKMQMNGKQKYASPKASLGNVASFFSQLLSYSG